MGLKEENMLNKKTKIIIKRIENAVSNPKFNKNELAMGYCRAQPGV